MFVVVERKWLMYCCSVWKIPEDAARAVALSRTFTSAGGSRGQSFLVRISFAPFIIIALPHDTLAAAESWPKTL
jgi:hypothetical protein